jgi:hypothetical protein
MRIFSIFGLFNFFLSALATNNTCVEPTNNCISFTVGSGTGCDWMCNYCSNQLGTNNYYFVDGVCTYQSGGCVGSPVSGKQYSCCSV